MNWFDIVIVAVILGATFTGTRVGLMRSVFLFGAFIIAAVISGRIAAAFAKPLGELVHNPDLGYFISFAAAFVLIFFILSVIGSIVCRIADFPPLKWLDRWVGGVLGFLAGIVFVGLVILYLTRSPVSGSQEWLEGSALAPIIKSIIRGVLGKEPEIHSVALIGLCYTFSGD